MELSCLQKNLKKTFSKCLDPKNSMKREKLDASATIRLYWLLKHPVF